MKRRSKILAGAAALLFWVGIWELFARTLDLPFALPTVADTLRALWRLLRTGAYWQKVGWSLLRILLGFACGTLLGTALGALAGYLPFFASLFSPIMTVIRSTPVASFIMVLWILIGSGNVPTAIAVLMVTPLTWQGTRGAIAALDPKLTEVARVYGFSLRKRMRALYLPAMEREWLPPVIHSVGFAWKAGIAAEIISYTKNSIGREMFDAKAFLQSAELFAWTLTVIFLSLLLEGGLRYLTERRIKSRDTRNPAPDKEVRA